MDSTGWDNMLSRQVVILNTIALCFKTCNSYTPIILEIQNQASLMKWSYLLGDCNVNKAQVFQRKMSRQSSLEERS